MSEHGNWMPDVYASSDKEAAASLALHAGIAIGSLIEQRVQLLEALEAALPYLKTAARNGWGDWADDGVKSASTVYDKARAAIAAVREGKDG